jgi:hypothetical protein
MHAERILYCHLIMDEHNQCARFIKHYYGMLAKNPAELHKFFMEDSFFMHSESLQVS